jgi:hypothetical protein
MEAITSNLSKKIIAIVLAIVLLLGSIGYQGYYNLLREDFTQYESLEDNFKYGSIGTEAVQGIPYWIWLVLPRIFSDKLPGAGGYTSLGLVWEPGQETPVGMSKQTIGFPRVGVNCAVCHNGTYRKVASEPPVIVPAAPSSKFDSLGYLRFLWAAAADERFTADYLLDEIKYNHEFSWVESLLYRYLLIPATRKALLEQAKNYSWTNTRPAWGAGRIDPFNPVKFGMLKLPIDDTVGNSDMMPLWNEEQHQGFGFHWDGLETSLTETVISGALGDGATKKSLPLANLQRVEEYIRQVQPPVYPFAIDQSLVAQGKPIFQANCASCHAFGGERTGQPVAEVGTDDNRLKMWTQPAADAYNNFGDPDDFVNFRRTNAYISPSLEGLWLRAPYLHNGSVPTLTDLLNKPADRPVTFYRGYDVYDPKQVGFVASGVDATKHGYKYEITTVGNSNQGHVYGTELSSDQKKALVEYLKTL